MCRVTHSPGGNLRHFSAVQQGLCGGGLIYQHGQSTRLERLFWSPFKRKNYTTCVLKPHCRHDKPDTCISHSNTIHTCNLHDPYIAKRFVNSPFYIEKRKSYLLCVACVPSMRIWPSNLQSYYEGRHMP